MTETRPKRPKFVRSHILQCIFEWKTSETAYDAIRLPMRRYMFTEACFEDWYFRFTNALQPEDYERSDFREIFYQNPKVFRLCILSDVICKKNVFKAYKEFCEMVGTHKVNYREFDYWFWRFSNGDHDLDYDRTKDPKQVEFSELPIDVVEKILEKLELKEQMVARKVSHSLQTILDKQKPQVSAIRAVCLNDAMYMKFGSEEVMYASTDNSKIRWAIFWKGLFGRRVVRDTFFLERAFDDVAVVLKNKKLQLDSLNIVLKKYRSENPRKRVRADVGKGFFKSIQTLILSLGHKIPVKSLYFDGQTESELIQMMSVVKAGVLKSIVMEEDSQTVKWKNMDKLLRSEHWSHLKTFAMSSMVFPDYKPFLHFRAFSIGLAEITLQDIAEIRDIISQSESFEMCKLSIKPNYINLELSMVPNLIGSTEYSYQKSYVYSIPKTNFVLLFSTSNHAVHIQKIEKITVENTDNTNDD